MQRIPPVDAAAAEPLREAPLRRAAGSGFSWMMPVLLAGKVLHFAVQMVLGALLLDEQFGTLAIATAVATFVRVFTDGGIPQVLVQRGREHYERLAGPSFWITVCSSLLTAALLAGVSLPVARLYGDPALVPLLGVIALSLPLDAPAAALRSKLRMDLRFGAIALITLGSLVIRYATVIGLAYAGYGVMSFVIPLPFAAAFASLATLAAARELPLRRGGGWPAWKELIGSSAWVLLTSFFRGFGRNGDYLVLGLTASQATVGQYFFGYQLAAQIAMLLAMNMQQVLFPVLSRVASDLPRHAVAIANTMRVLLLAAAPISLGLAVTIEPLETLIWHGKWSRAVPLMQIFAVVTPLRLLPDVVLASLAARGLFRGAALLGLLEGIQLMLATWATSLAVGDDLVGLALGVGGSQAAFALAAGWYYAVRCGVSTADFLRAVLPAWLVACLAAALTALADRAGLASLAPLPRLAADAGLFLVLFVVLARGVLAGHLAQLATSLPGPLGPLVRRALLLPPLARCT